MILKNIFWISCSLLFAGCHFPYSTQENTQINELKLGNIQTCKQYSGVPENWLKDKHAGMVWIAAGSFELGSDLAYPDEINFGEKQRSVQGFWIDQTEVTVAQFKKFVDSTHYMTDAEKQKEVAVFSPNIEHPQQWWQLKSGYTWKTPYGKKGQPPNLAEPVRYVTKNDAEHYAIWLNHKLPSELEWEYAAKANTST